MICMFIYFTVLLDFIFYSFQSILYRAFRKSVPLLAENIALLKQTELRSSHECVCGLKRTIFDKQGVYPTKNQYSNKHIESLTENFRFLKIQYCSKETSYKKNTRIAFVDKLYAGL